MYLFGHYTWGSRHSILFFSCLIFRFSMACPSGLPEKTFYKLSVIVIYCCNEDENFFSIQCLCRTLLELDSAYFRLGVILSLAALEYKNFSSRCDSFINCP